MVARVVGIVALLSALLNTGCSVVGIRSGTEEPKYIVVQTLGALQIRRYGPLLAAETTVRADEYAARSGGFRRLATFIFGGNHRAANIAMTAPVAQSSASSIAMTAPVSQDQSAMGEWRIRFFMPAQYTAASLPQPNDPLVRIVSVPGQTVGVYRYSGSIDPGSVAGAQRELLRLLQGSGWIAAGGPVTWFYDPPWTIPFLRRNEAVVPVARPG